MNAWITVLAQQSSGSGGAFGMIGALFGLVIWLVLILAIPALMFWKLFEKAGQPGWASVVPFYNLYILCKIAGRPAWWIILMFLPVISLIAYIIVCLDIAKSFAKGTGFAIGLILLSIVFFPVLGFGSAQYQGPAAAR